MELFRAKNRKFALQAFLLCNKNDQAVDDDADQALAHLLLCRTCGIPEEQLQADLSSLNLLPLSSILPGHNVVSLCKAEKIGPNQGAAALAIKSIKYNTSLSHEQWLENCVRELRISLLACRFSHESIIKTFGGFYAEDLDTFVIVSEFAPNGDLFDLLASDTSSNLIMDAQWILQTFKQIARGVEHLHQLGILHLDLKPENVLLFGERAERVKLCDFGLSLLESEMKDCSIKTGTLQYCGPELFTYCRPHRHGESNYLVSKALDMWGLGCILLVMLTKQTPFYVKGDDALCEADQRAWERVIVTRIVNADYRISRAVREHFGTGLCNVVTCLLTPEPEFRMNMPQLLAHPTLSGAK